MTEKSRLVGVFGNLIKVAQKISGLTDDQILDQVHEKDITLSKKGLANLKTGMNKTQEDKIIALSEVFGIPANLLGKTQAHKSKAVICISGKQVVQISLKGWMPSFNIDFEPENPKVQATILELMEKITDFSKRSYKKTCGDIKALENPINIFDDQIEETRIYFEIKNNLNYLKKNNVFVHMVKYGQMDYLNIYPNGYVDENGEVQDTDGLIYEFDGATQSRSHNSKEADQWFEGATHRPTLFVKISANSDKEIEIELDRDPSNLLDNRSPNVNPLEQMFAETLFIEFYEENNLLPENKLIKLKSILGFPTFKKEDLLQGDKLQELKEELEDLELQKVAVEVSDVER